MARFSFSSGRARAARFTGALALVLAVAGIPVAAVASASGGAGTSAKAVTVLRLNCNPQGGEVVAGTTVKCVVAAASTTAPTGTVALESIGFANIGSAECKFTPISTTNSFCEFSFRVTAPGRLEVFANYTDATHQFAFDEEVFQVNAGGSIEVGCTPERGFEKEPSSCEAFVPNTPGLDAPPSGTVHFTAEFPIVPSVPAGNIDPECTLKAVPGGARCAVEFVPNFGGLVGVIADYAGDASHPVQFGSLAYSVANQHETEMSTSCDTETPNTATPTTCTAIVTNQDAVGGAPTGEVEFDASGELGFFPGSSSCDLKAVAPGSNEASCQVKFQPRKPGRVILATTYKGAEHFEFRFDFIEFNIVVGHTTATQLVCLASHGTGSAVCLATVIDTSANPTAPPGRLTVKAPDTVKFNRTTCTLMPTSTPGRSSCAFSYTMTTAGKAAVVAEYVGDPSGFVPSSATATASNS